MVLDRWKLLGVIDGVFGKFLRDRGAEVNHIKSKKYVFLLVGKAFKPGDYSRCILLLLKFGRFYYGRIDVVWELLAHFSKD